MRSLIRAAPHPRQVLIAHLHLLNDAYRGLHERHLVALAKEMNLPMAEVNPDDTLPVGARIFPTCLATN